VFGVDRLIVGTSESPGSLQALRYGEVLAHAHDAVLVPVIAWELPGGDRGQRIGPSHELGQACRDLAGQPPEETAGHRAGQVYGRAFARADGQQRGVCRAPVGVSMRRCGKPDRRRLI
jgi:hypothetical protein